MGRLCAADGGGGLGVLVFEVDGGLVLDLTVDLKK